MARRKWSQEEIDEFRNMKGSIFYCNKEDSNFVISRKLGIGWSFNWANPISWVFTLAIFAVVIITSIFFE
jgi:uncharacterized membrane protein